MTNTVGPVIISHPRVRNFLESTGLCYSFRTQDRTTGNTHYRYERTGPKQGDVYIEQVTDQTRPTRDALFDYHHLSGFTSIRDWRIAIDEIHGDLDTPGYVYRIRHTGGGSDGK